MTTIIKSNQVSTNNLGNIFGLSKMDFALMMDFNQDVYLKKANGINVEVALDTLLDCKRSTAGTYFDVNGVLQVAPPNTPRLSYSQETGRRGLLVEGHTRHLFLNEQNPVTQTINNVTTSPITLSVWGSGSITASGSGVTSKMTDGGLTATQGKPVLVSAANGTITITVDGSPKCCSVTQPASTVFGGSSSRLPIPNGSSSSLASFDMCKLAAGVLDSIMTSKKEMTVLMTYSANPHPTKSTNSAAKADTIFCLRNTSFTRQGIYVYGTEGTTLISGFNTLSGNSDSQVASETFPARQVRALHRAAVSYKNFGDVVSVAMDSHVRTKRAEGNIINPDTIILGIDDGYRGQSAAINAVITSLVVYPYAMTEEELRTITAVEF